MDEHKARTAVRMAFVGLSNTEDMIYRVMVKFKQKSKFRKVTLPPHGSTSICSATVCVVGAASSDLRWYESRSPALMARSDPTYLLREEAPAMYAHACGVGGVGGSCKQQAHPKPQTHQI